MTERLRYLSVMVRDHGEPLPCALVWVEWSNESGHRDRGPILGPVPVLHDDVAAVTSLRAEWIAELAGFQRNGPWSATPDGFVAWLAPRAATATAPMAVPRTPRRGRR